MPTLARIVLGAGIVGAAASLLFAVVALPGLARVDAALDRSDAALTAAAAAARSAAQAFDGFDASLDEATRSAADAAALATRSADTARGLASAMSLSIFGTQPLLPLATGFEASAADLEALGDTLSIMGGALEGNREDLASLQAQIDRLAAELTELAQPRDLPALLWAGVGLLLLLAVQSAGLVAAGVALSRLDARSDAAAAGL